MGQAFFSLSLGMGCLCTYASYFRNDTNLPKTALNVAGIDTLVAILAGFIIFLRRFPLHPAGCRTEFIVHHLTQRISTGIRQHTLLAIALSIIVLRFAGAGGIDFNHFLTRSGNSISA